MKYLMDLHTHTVASIHAYSTVIENARAAKQQGLEILGVSDHGYGMAHTTVPDYWKNLHALPRYLEGVRLLVGMEANIKNEEGVLTEEADFPRVDYVIASLHGVCYDGPANDPAECTRAMCRAMAHPRVKILGHPDDDRHPVDYEVLVRTAKAEGVALEVNNSSLRPYSARKGAYENMKRYLALAKKEACPIIVNSDAHVATAVGDFDLAEAVLQEMAFPEELIINRSWRALEDLLGISL